MDNSADMPIPTWADVVAAHERIAPHIRHTEVLTSEKS